MTTSDAGGSREPGDGGGGGGTREAGREGDRLGAALLVAGAVLGIGLAAWGLARSGAPAEVPAGAVAVVNGEPISAEAFRRFADAVAAEREEPALAPAERHRLLERMIDEELLLQRGLALGLARHEPAARRAIVSAVIAALTAEAEAGEPSEAALRDFYAKNGQRFARTPRLEVDAAFVAGGGGPEETARERAARIARRLRAGDPFAEVSEELGDRPTAPVPGGPLPVETLRRYVGPTAARTAERLAVGEVSEPVRGVGGYHVLALRGRLPGRIPPFESVREQVRAEYLRSLGEEALRRTLVELRDDAEIAVDTDAVRGR